MRAIHWYVPQNYPKANSKLVQVRCAACLAVTDLRIYNAPTPPQAALAPIEPKNKARVEDKDESSSEQAVNLETVPEAAMEKAPNLLQPILPIQPSQPQPLIEKVEEIDPEYASDDEAVKVRSQLPEVVYLVCPRKLFVRESTGVRSELVTSSSS